MAALWRDRAITTIRGADKTPKTTDRWSPSRPSRPASMQAQMLVGQMSAYGASEPIIEPTIEGGFQIESENGTRELDFAIVPNGSIVLLQVEDEKLIGERQFNLEELGSLLDWLARARKK